MAVDNEVEIVIRAVDAATKELTKIQGTLSRFGDEGQASGRKVQDEFKKQGDAMKNTGVKANQLQSEWEKLTSSTEFAAQGLQTLRSSMSSLIWGTLIGAAVAATAELIRLSLAAEDSAKKLDELENSIVGLTKELNPALEKTEAFRRAQFELSVAQLALAKARAMDTLAQIEQDVAGRDLIDTWRNQSLALNTLKRLFGITKEDMGDLEKFTRDFNQETEVMEKRIAQLKLVMDASIPTWEEFQTLAGRPMTAAETAQEQLGQAILDTAMAQRAAQQAILDRIDAETLLNDVTSINRDEQETAAAIDAQQRMLDQLETNSILRKAESDERDLERARNHQEALGRIIAEHARAEWEQIQQTEALKTAAREASFDAATNLAEALYVFSGQKSKALFQVWKAAATAQAVVDTYAAANKALASAPPPYNFALAAAVVAAGLANVARITSQQFGGGGGGGGGGAASPAPPPVGLEGDLRGRNQAPPPAPPHLTVIIQGNVIGQEAWIQEELVPALEEASLNERSKIALKGN